MSKSDKAAGAAEPATSPIGVAVLGLGNVGSEVVRIIEQTAPDLAARIGAPLELRGVAVRNVSGDRGVPREMLTENVEELVSREDVDIVVELMGPVEPARKAILTALEHGKSVVTANKALLAQSTGELAQAAERAHVDLYFEAAVAGAIPVIRPLTQSLAGDTVVRVAGIVNGTTNYILSEMASTGADYAAALADASALGYAEADPTADVEGYDAAAKAAILASIAFHTRVTADDVYREGITKVTPADFESARALGCTIKLLSICERIVSDDGQERFRPGSTGAGAVDPPAGHGQRRVQRGGRGGGGLRPADVLRQGAGGKPTALGGDGRSGDGRPQPGAGRPRSPRIEVRAAAHRPDGCHPDPLLRQHDRQGPAGRVVLGGSRIRQPCGQHRRGAPGGHRRRRGSAVWRPHRGRHAPGHRRGAVGHRRRAQRPRRRSADQQCAAVGGGTSE